MSYESFKNKETWLLNVWGYIDEIANTWIETERPNGASVSDITSEYCRETFEQFIEDTCNKLPVGIVQDFVNDSISTIDWYEVTNHVKDTIRETQTT